ncbi:MAG: hypothetical protein F6J99_10295, partial [Moorea sp. SIO4G3]|nr:hypothetical protein [Moorena sp. SIO4G3]
MRGSYSEQAALILILATVGLIGSVGRWGDGEMGRWGDGEILEILTTVPDSRFPTPDSRLPTPYSLLPTPYSLLP